MSYKRGKNEDTELMETRTEPHIMAYLGDWWIYWNVILYCNEVIADAVGVTDDIVEMDVGVMVKNFDVVIDLVVVIIVKGCCYY